MADRPLHHFSWSWTRRIKSTPPNPISLRSILILSPHPRPVIPSGFVPSDFLIKTVYACLSFHARATCPAKEIFLDLLSLCCYFPSCSIGETPVTNQFTEPFFLLDHGFSKPGSRRKFRLLENYAGSWNTPQKIQANLMAYIGR